MSVIRLSTTEPPAGPTPSESAMPPSIAVSVPQPQPLTYIFDLYRDGKVAGGGLIIGPTPAAAARTVEMTMAGGAKAHILGFIRSRTHPGSAA